MRLPAFAAEGAALPKIIRVLNWGENKTASGRKAVCGSLTLSALRANQERFGFAEVALDYEHNTVPGTRAYRESQEPRKVAAYGTLVPIEGEGVFFVPSRWTPSGLKDALEFQDLSPAPATSQEGEVIFIHSVALCRQGDIEDLHFVPFSATNPTREETHQEIEIMDYKAKLIELVNALGIGAALAPDATDAELEARVSEVAKAKADAGAGVQAMSDVTALAADVKALKARDVERELAEIRSQAAREGKVIPLSAEQLAATAPAVLRDMVARLPATVPLSRRTPAVEPLSAAGNSIIEKYNAISDPEERARFFAAHRADIVGK